MTGEDHPDVFTNEDLCACERGPVGVRDCPRGGTCSICCHGCAADCAARASDEDERAEAIAAELSDAPVPPLAAAVESEVIWRPAARGVSAGWMPAARAPALARTPAPAPAWTLMFSLREPYATSIVRGLKTVEFRRRIPAAVRDLAKGQRVRILVYASRRGRLLGEVSCTGLIAASPADLWRLVVEQGRTPGIDRVRFHEYFTRAPIGYGLLLADPVEYAKPLEATLHAGFRAPQSFAYAGSLPPSLIEAADAAAEEARRRG